MKKEAKLTCNTKSHICLLGASALIAASCSACAGSVFERSSEHGRILISADAEGMKSFGDYSNGLISNSRISPDLESSYWQHRKQETAVRGLRFRVKKEGE